MPVRALCVHPGFVRTPMTDRLAWGEDGRRWLPGFAAGAENRWGDARPAAELVEAIVLGIAGQLTAGSCIQAMISARFRRRKGALPSDLFCQRCMLLQAAG
jgi:NAD(P)-dependent dehydrogenase (short-subunit alcohol dehydrogenase family)